MPLISSFSPQNASPLVNALFQLGRIILASLFMLGGVDKIMDPATSVSAMEAVGLPAPALLIWPTISVELGLGLIVAAGGWLASGRFVAGAALLLVLHVAAVNSFFHPFWTMDGAQARVELSLFFKNVAVAGGLSMIAGLYLGKRHGT